MIRRALFALPLVLALPLLHCGDDDDGHVTPQPLGDGGASGDGATAEPDKPLVPASKVNLLFAVDNSASMGDKQALLGTAVSRILRRLTDGSADHKAVTDIHVGVISSSLGTLGGDICGRAGGNPRTNDGAHLLNKDTAGNIVPGAEGGFLTFGPGGDIAVLEKAARDIIVGVGQRGCGFEAQLESMYRFLIQPDPPMSITVDNQKVVFNGIDSDLLKQRKAFLRPDSAVAIVMLTDEDDSIADPLSNGGSGWGFNSINFPGSGVRRGTTGQGTTAPRGTSVCDTNPGSPDCISCVACNRDDACKAKHDANCSAPGDPNVPGSEGFLAPLDDDFNIRFSRMKERFGVDPRFPVERYIKALTNRKVPNRETEHDAAGNYVHTETCTNPLFAASLPASGTDDGCHMPEGDRSRQLVMFQLIGGLPPALANQAPDWTKILGANPDAYDLTGIDPHMIQSSTPRPALISGGDPESMRGKNGSDPVQGREWDTKKKDLQYACTFVLPTPRSCAGNQESCDCADDPVQAGSAAGNPPLCAEDGTASQTRGKAYPTLRELRVVKGLADRGLVGSICSVDTTSGYGPLLDNLATKVATVLAK